MCVNVDSRIARVRESKIPCPFLTISNVVSQRLWRTKTMTQNGADKFLLVPQVNRFWFISIVRGLFCTLHVDFLIFLFFQRAQLIYGFHLPLALLAYANKSTGTMLISRPRPFIKAALCQLDMEMARQLKVVLRRILVSSCRMDQNKISLISLNFYPKQLVSRVSLSRINSFPRPRLFLPVLQSSPSMGKFVNLFPTSE